MAPSVARLGARGSFAGSSDRSAVAGRRSSPRRRSRSPSAPGPTRARMTFLLGHRSSPSLHGARSRASAAASARRAPRGGWPTPRRTSSTACCRARRIASGCSPCPSRCGSGLRAILRGRAGSATSPSARSAPGNAAIARAARPPRAADRARSRSCSGSGAWSTSTCTSTCVVPDGVFVDDDAPASRSRSIRCRPAPTCSRSSIASCAGSRAGSPTRRATIDAEAHRRARTGPGRGGGDVALAARRQTDRARCRAAARRGARASRLHAGVVIADHDREALERLCRYGARPAFAHDRLAWTADGRIAYRLKRPWPDGRTELVLPPVAFLRRLCGIIPPPRRHLVRYAGVFGPASQRRAQLRALVPAPWRRATARPRRRRAARRGPAGSRGPSCCAGCSPPTCCRARAVAVAAWSPS